MLGRILKGNYQTQPSPIQRKYMLTYMVLFCPNILMSHEENIINVIEIPPKR